MGTSQHRHGLSKRRRKRKEKRKEEKKGKKIIQFAIPSQTVAIPCQIKHPDTIAFPTSAISYDREQCPCCIGSCIPFVTQPFITQRFFCLGSSRRYTQHGSAISRPAPGLANALPPGQSFEPAAFRTAL